ncbi:glycosyl hydrolase family 65 protein [Mucilaginibacter sp. dw_454]|uniref:MGH1-like glycoside hydrolase domain-containing protein n=1 Tax=Mucilaginibacter sp. dw_454 TaxID=2720079 RepID=UPI001BD5DE35|nr:glycosyl hydrolase family 65 protein [Mucilaginibacter sp. dw_454]
MKKNNKRSSAGFFMTMLCLFFCTDKLHAQVNFLLKADNYKAFIDQFNRDDDELYKEHFPNDSAWGFLRDNMPLLDCPDQNIERTYYFRWWTYRKHIKLTPDGYVITEFLPQVPWSGKYNTISCPLGQHFYEGRWLKDTKYLNDNAVFWLQKGGDLHSYSNWFADALWANYEVSHDARAITKLLPDLVKSYRQWETGKIQGGKFTGKNPDGLFSSIDDRDGMEMSIGGSGERPTINSYMYGDAIAIAKIAHLKGDIATAKIFTQKADSLRTLILSKLWDKKDSFFKVLPFDQTQLVAVKEIMGYTPWYFNIPTQGAGYEQAWSYIKSTKGFYAPYGLTSAGQDAPGFKLAYTGHECQWNGPSWPFSTSVTLTALANVLNNYSQDVVSPADYFKQLAIYAGAQQRVTADDKTLPWIDEVLNPYTGDWISRTILERAGWQKGAGGRERGKDYNHSTFCDLVISGLIGLRPQSDNTVIINPLIPPNTWNWFCLDNVSYHGKTLTIVYDKFGTKYHKGKGLMCFINGKLMAHAERLQKISFELK